MESQQEAPKAPPRRRTDDRSGSSSLASLGPPAELDGSEHPALRAQEFHRLHRSAIEITAEAQTADEEGKREDAFKAYNRALHFIDQAVSLAHQGGFADSDVNRVDDLTYKLRITRKQILERVTDLQIPPSTHETQDSYLQGPSGASSVASPSYASLNLNLNTGNNPLPSYEDAIRGTSAESTLSSGASAPPQAFNYRELVSVLDDIAAEQAAMTNPLPLNAHEVFSIPQNVQIYYISTDDNVSAPSYPSFLRVVVTDHNEEGGNNIPAFLQVGDWTYPLVARSPVLRTADGLYLFPDTNSKIPGSTVGLILPPDLRPEDRQTFDEILAQLLSLDRIPRAGHPEDIPATPPGIVPQYPDTSTATTPTSPTEATRRFSTKIAEGLVSGAEAVSSGLVFCATKTSILLDKGTSYLQSRMDPAKEKPVIKPEVRKGMKVAKTVTGKAVQVSGYLVNQVGNATMALGRHLAPHVQRAGTKLISKTTSNDDVEASKKMDQVLEVTSGAVAGFGTLYLGLEASATVLANSLANNTVQIINHRYGEEAGALANDTAAATGGAVMTAWNVQQLGPKAMARKVAKDTGKQVIKNYKEKKHPPSGNSSPPGGGGGGGASGSQPI